MPIGNRNVPIQSAEDDRPAGDEMDELSDEEIAAQEAEEDRPDDVWVPARIAEYVAAWPPPSGSPAANFGEAAEVLFRATWPLSIEQLERIAAQHPDCHMLFCDFTGWTVEQALRRAQDDGCLCEPKPIEGQPHSPACRFQRGTQYDGEASDGR